MKEKIKISIIAEESPKVKSMICKFENYFEIKLVENIDTCQMHDSDVYIVHSKFWDSVKLNKLPAFGIHDGLDEDKKLAALKKFIDVISLDVSAEEIHLRVTNQLKEVSPQSSISVGNLTIDIDRSLVTIDEKILGLTLIETKILFFLVRNRKTSNSRRSIMESVWPNIYTSAQTLNTHLARIRNKTAGWNHSLITLKNGDLYIED